MENIIQRCRRQGIRLTPQRLAILEYLDGNTSHPTADDIYAWIKKRYPGVSFATVYNTLKVLVEMNEALELTIDPERKHYDPNPLPHHHVVCARCGRIGDVFADYSKVLRLPGKVRNEFTIKGNHVDFHGTCKECETGGEPTGHPSAGWVGMGRPAPNHKK